MATIRCGYCGRYYDDGYTGALYMITPRGPVRLSGGVFCLNDRGIIRLNGMQEGQRSKAFPSGEGGSRVSRKRETDEG